MTKHRTFACYRQCDVYRFIQLLDAEGAILCGVTRDIPGLLNYSYLISYLHSEEIEMEVFC